MTDTKPEIPIESKKILIIAPHNDDEIIGCFSVITKNDYYVMFTDPNIPKERREEAMKLRDTTNCKGVFFNGDIPPIFLNPDTEFYCPHPIHEKHPLHRKWGAIGESMAREGFDVTFYVTNMDAPFIREVENPEAKERLLNAIYPSQKSLWETEKKYILFEGYCKWVFK